MNYGASSEEWAIFDFVFGLTADLLPVVSNPQAEISGKSAIKQMGKVPSRYNVQRKVVGITDWTSHIASDTEITKWSKEPDYGICLQTRNIRALDLDITDPDEVAKVTDFVHAELQPHVLPIRLRRNSPKCLIAFRVAGNIPKRVIRVSSGIIEFLATGQQMVVSGTHPSGARYEWENLIDFPELTLEEFNALWDRLVDKFAVEQPSTANIRKVGDSFAADDPTVDKLTILGWGPQGQAHIECPFRAEHTTESGESSTSYFPKGTQGYEQGHFVCLHAHCASRGDHEFLDALGLRAQDFDVVASKAVVPYPRFKRDKAGEIYPTIDNLCRALQRDDVCAARIAYDSFRDEVVITSAKTHALSWRTLADNDYTDLQRHLESSIGFKPISLELLRRSVNSVANDNIFDSAILWLNGLTWDGVPRVETFMHRYLRAENSPYARAVSRYIWSAMAGRILKPGVQADMVPIWESGQGRAKSSVVEALVPDPEYFLEVDLNEKEDVLARKMRGKLIGEISELRGLQTKDAQGLLAWVTRKFEEWVPKYMEKSRRFARRLIFIATTNEKEILAATENRRWLPIRVEFADLASIKRDRDQLWAEGKEIFLKEGICFHQAEILARDFHKEYMVIDVWKDAIAQWLESPDDFGEGTPMDKGYVTIIEIMRDCLHLETKTAKGPEGKKIAKALRDLGFERKQIRMQDGDKEIERRWVPLASDLL